MILRKSKKEDLDALMEVFSFARSFMASTGNPYQWGHNQWPPRHVLEKDIEEGKGYVFVEGEEILGTFFLNVGEHVEPCYDYVEQGAWTKEGPYAVIHRIASNGKAKGILKAAVDYAFTLVDQVRIDTHEENKVMRSALAKLGFHSIGYIYVEQDTVRRIAFEKFKDR